MKLTNFKTGGDAYQAVAKRKDGSIRQIVVQNSKGEVLAMGFFGPGTQLNDPYLAEQVKYHWVDAFSDQELLDEGEPFNSSLLAKLREQALEANLEKEFVIENITDYKRK